MSQKTNPYSLRLQKSHKYFESCWYSDYFYNEINNHNLQIRSYIQSVFDQITYSQSILYTQNYYKRFVIYSFIQDTRGIRSEREQFLRSSFIEGTKIRTQLPVTVSIKAQDKLTSILFFWHKKSFSVSIFKQKCWGGKSLPYINILPPTISPERVSPQKIENKSFQFFDWVRRTDEVRTSSWVFAPRSSQHQGSGICTSSSQSVINYSSNNLLIETPLMGIVKANPSYPINFTSIYPIRIIQDTQNAFFLINEVIHLLQKRVGFKQIKDQILREILNTVGKKDYFRTAEDNHNRRFYPH